MWNGLNKLKILMIKDFYFLRLNGLFVDYFVHLHIFLFIQNCVNTKHIVIKGFPLRHRSSLNQIM